MTTDERPVCLFCERECERCGYTISGYFEHIEQPQPEGSNVVVCSSRRASRPMVEMIDGYFTHSFRHDPKTQAQTLADTLRLIGTDCRSFVMPTTCVTAGRKREAEYGAYRWCSGCQAREVLTVTGLL